MSEVRERRQHPRWLCSSLIDLTVVAGPRRGATHTGVIEDVSVGGMGIAMDGPVAVGETVQLSSGEYSIYAVVRYCSAGDNGTYRLGLAFDPAYQWSPLADWPDHRLDVPADQTDAVTVR